MGSLQDIFRITFITNQKAESSFLCAGVQQEDKKSCEERMRKENRCSLDTWRVPAATDPPSIPCQAEILGTGLSPDLLHSENSWWDSHRPRSTQWWGSRSRITIRAVPAVKERAWEFLIMNCTELTLSAKPSRGVSGYSDMVLGASQWF